MTSAQFAWPDLGPQGAYNLDFMLTINNEAPEYYWAHQFYFKNGDGGYMGLQTSARFNGTRTKVAIFSIWNAKSAEGAANGMSEAFGHEGSGYSCRIPYNWQQGVQYRVRLWKIEDNSNGDSWWGAWVTDMRTQKDDFIGKILVPASWSGLKPVSINFVEYWGMQDGKRHNCSEIPYTNSLFSFPSMNDGTINPLNAAYKAYGECESIARTGTVTSRSYQAITGIRL
jgi:hypothetical protein